MNSLVDEIIEQSDSLQSAIVITDGYRIPVYANSAFCDLCGYSLDELVNGDPLGKRLPADDLTEAARHKFRENLNSNFPFQFAFKSVRKDGSNYLVGGFLLPFLEPKAGVRLVAVEREIESLDSNVFECRTFKNAVRSICNIISSSNLGF